MKKRDCRFGDVTATVIGSIKTVGESIKM